MEAIILAGGFGTRLFDIVQDVPKPMAPVNGEPFLKYIFDHLLNNGVTHTVLAVGYKAAVIRDYFGDVHKNFDTSKSIQITYSTEDTPLGTGGAIKKALEYCSREDVFIINGDTYFDVDLIKMYEFHFKMKSKLTIAVKSMINYNRYGSVVIENDIIKRFDEKAPTEQGLINGGTYLLKKEIFESLADKSFSFEKKILECGLVEIYAFNSDGYFIDIGVPEDYYKAQCDFRKN